MDPSNGSESHYQGKTALITGASRGIGAAVARRLARAGANLVINHREARGRSGKLAEALCAEAEAAGVRAISVPADIGKKKGTPSKRGAPGYRFVDLAGYAATSATWNDLRCSALLTRI